MPTPYQAIMADAANMSTAQLETFTKGVRLIELYHEGRFMGKVGKPKLLVAAPAATELLLNAMAYLTNFCPASDIKFPTLYRVHDFSKIRSIPEVGSTVKIKPFRSFLSWSADKNISVEGVDDHDKEGLLGINGTQAKVIFSYRVVKSLKPDNRAVEPRLRDLAAKLESLYRTFPNFAGEQEVVVYHAKPFTAKLLRFIVASKAVDEIVKSMGILRYLEKSRVIPKGKAYQVKEGHLAEVFDLLKKHLKSPSSRRSTKSYKSWLGPKQWFTLDLNSSELVITNLKR